MKEHIKGQNPLPPVKTMYNPGRIFLKETLNPSPLRTREHSPDSYRERGEEYLCGNSFTSLLNG